MDTVASTTGWHKWNLQILNRIDKVRKGNLSINKRKFPDTIQTEMTSWVWNTWNSLLNNHSVINAPSVICVQVMIKQLLGKHRRYFYSSVLPTEQPLHQKTRANIYTTATSIRSWFNFILGIQVKIQILHVFIALKGSHFWFLFDFTAAGVVPCGGRKTSPRTSTIVQFIFYFCPLRSAIIFWGIRNKWLI